MILFAHAQKIVDEDKPVAGLFLGTGSTKTRISLFLARGSTLVICPKMQKEDRNWEREVQKIRQVKKDFHIDLTVISKEEFRARAKTLKRFDTVIGDEAHTLLGATPYVRYVKKQPIPKTSQLFEELRDYIDRTKPSRIYLATATIGKTAMTVWAAGIILGKNWDFYEWRDAFYVSIPMGRRDIWIQRKEMEVKDRLVNVIRNLGYTGRLQDYFDVPEQTYKQIFVKLTESQKLRLKEIRTDFPDPLVQIGKRHQIENGVLAGDEYNEPEAFDNAKIDTIIDLSVEFPKMIVFAKYTAQIRAIAEALKKEDKNVLVLDGSTKDRGALMAEANALDEYVLVAQSQISAGWELPECPVMVFASLSNSMVDRVQAEGRILRANHLKKNLFIDIVVNDVVKIGKDQTLKSIDKAVYDSISDKKDFDERIYSKEESLL